MPIAVVTGGAGFIGSHLAAGLLKKGFNVRVVDNLSTGKKSNLDAVINDLEFVRADIRDRDAMKRAFAGAELVFHQAALASVARSMADPWETTDVNVMGTLSVLQAASDAGVRRIVAASSSSVYGDTESFPERETDYPLPISPYAASKITTEFYYRVFNMYFGVETVALRYFNVFGPRQDPDSPYAAVIPKFLDLMTRGKPPIIFGDGTQSRDFTFVENVVHANIIASRAEKAPGEMFNIACGKTHDLLELVALLNRELGTDFQPKLTEPRQGDPMTSLASMEKSSALLGFHEVVSFEEGIKRTVASFVKD